MPLKVMNDSINTVMYVCTPLQVYMILISLGNSNMTVKLGVITRSAAEKNLLNFSLNKGI